MKKTLLMAVFIVVVLGLIGAGVVYAQGGQPPQAGMMGNGSYGWMHDYVAQALAAKLGLTEERVEDALAAGKPMVQIALDNGIAQEELASFMNEIHKDAFDKAVKDNVITQERADWMLQRMQNMYQNGTGAAGCPMHNGQGGQFERGRGMGPGMMGSGRGSGMLWGQGAQNP
jgi:hypothetical protein